MTQGLQMPSLSNPEHNGKEYTISDCPQCGAIAEIHEAQPNGLMVFCTMCGFMVASAIDSEFAVNAWNDLYKRGE